MAEPRNWAADAAEFVRIIQAASPGTAIELLRVKLELTFAEGHVHGFHAGGNTALSAIDHHFKVAS